MTASWRAQARRHRAVRQLWVWGNLLAYLLFVGAVLTNPRLIWTDKLTSAGGVTVLFTLANVWVVWKWKGDAHADSAGV